MRALSKVFLPRKRRPGVIPGDVTRYLFVASFAIGIARAVSVGAFSLSKLSFLSRPCTVAMHRPRSLARTSIVVPPSPTATVFVFSTRVVPRRRLGSSIRRDRHRHRRRDRTNSGERDRPTDRPTRPIRRRRADGGPVNHSTRAKGRFHRSTRCLRARFHPINKNDDDRRSREGDDAFEDESEDESTCVYMRVYEQTVCTYEHSGRDRV